jgi:hypothetical protein
VSFNWEIDVFLTAIVVVVAAVGMQRLLLPVNMTNFRKTFAKTKTANESDDKWVSQSDFMLSIVYLHLFLCGLHMYVYMYVCMYVCMYVSR